MSASAARDRRLRVPLKVTYKVIITNPDGSIAKVIEGTQDDPFTYSFVFLFYTSLIAPSQYNDIPDVAGTELFLFTPAVPAGYTGPAVAIPYPAAALCLVNCPGTPNAPYAVKLPGIWLFSTPFGSGASIQPMASTIYSSLITNITYYTPSLSPSITANVGATNTITITQNFTNTSGSPITIHSFAVVAAFYPVTSSGLAGTPYFIDISYFNLPTPVVWSPAAGMTVQASFTVPT
jgi:hypothetical protein